MKYRSSFVTNSSSSSFICDVCGNVESGWDLSLSDAYMYECENGHTICQSHVKGDLYSKENVVKALEKFIKDNENSTSEYTKRNVDKAKGYIADQDKLDEDEIVEIADDFLEVRYGIPEHLCPVCNLSQVLEHDILNYILVKYNINKASITKEIKKEFKTISELQAFNRGK